MKHVKSEYAAWNTEVAEQFSCFLDMFDEPIKEWFMIAATTSLLGEAGNNVGSSAVGSQRDHVAARRVSPKGDHVERSSSGRVRNGQDHVAKNNLRD